MYSLKICSHLWEAGPFVGTGQFQTANANQQFRWQLRQIQRLRESGLCPWGRGLAYHITFFVGGGPDRLEAKLECWGSGPSRGSLRGRNGGRGGGSGPSRGQQGVLGGAIRCDMPPPPLQGKARNSIKKRS
eukprot:1185509-Prorocentrum_minimum.AAC.2